MDVEECGPEAMDVKERKPYRSLTRRRDAERRYTSSSADSEEVLLFLPTFKTPSVKEFCFAFIPGSSKPSMLTVIGAQRCWLDRDGRIMVSEFLAPRTCRGGEKFFFFIGYKLDKRHFCEKNRSEGAHV